MHDQFSKVWLLKQNTTPMFYIMIFNFVDTESTDKCINTNIVIHLYFSKRFSFFCSVTFFYLFIEITKYEKVEPIIILDICYDVLCLDVCLQLMFVMFKTSRFPFCSVTKNYYNLGFMSSQ